MEISCYARVRFKSQEQLALAQSMLEVHPDCPLFDDEVEPSLQTTFRELEFIALPKSVTRVTDDSVLMFYWFLSNSDDATSAGNAFIRSGVMSLIILGFDDEGGVFGHSFDGEQAQRIIKWKGKPLQKIRTKKGMTKIMAKMEKKLIHRE